jgi:hypothetical protein
MTDIGPQLDDNVLHDKWVYRYFCNFCNGHVSEKIWDEDEPCQNCGGDFAFGLRRAGRIVDGVWEWHKPKGDIPF